MLSPVQFTVQDCNAGKQASIPVTVTIHALTSWCGGRATEHYSDQYLLSVQTIALGAALDEFL